MKTELKRELFQSAANLCNFVNEHNITKGNIQSIVENSGVLVLFYWNETSCKEGIKRLADFIEPREKRIAELEEENAELKSELSALKTSDY